MYSFYSDTILKYFLDVCAYCPTKLPSLMCGHSVVKRRVPSDFCTTLCNQQDDPSGKAPELFFEVDDLSLSEQKLA